MIVLIGSGGHASEVVSLLLRQKIRREIYLYDDTGRKPERWQIDFPMVTTKKQLQDLFKQGAHFIVAIGGPGHRERLYNECISANGEPMSAIADSAIISEIGVELGSGLNIMERALISANAFIGTGTLVNYGAAIHHNAYVGDYSEISPAALLLGGVRVGKRCSVGAGAVILPKIAVGDDVVIGAGAVVTRSIQSGTTVKGIPAR